MEVLGLFRLDLLYDEECSLALQNVPYAKLEAFQPTPCTHHSILMHVRNE